MTENPISTYIADHYGEDMVLTKVGDVIANAPALWQLMLQLDGRVDLAKSGLQGYRMEYVTSFKDATHVELTIDVVVKEIMGHGSS